MTCQTAELDCNVEIDDYIKEDGTHACKAACVSGARAEDGTLGTCVEGPGTDGTMTVYSCMADLQMQLLVIFAAKQFLLKLSQYAMPLFKASATEKKHKMQYKLMKEKKQHDTQDHIADVNDQHNKVEYEGVFMDYSELAIQFGYTTLFAVAFPVAPAMCALANIIEQRLDAYKLCRVFRRPQIETRENIGAWATVFDALAVGAVMTNAALVGFVGSQMSDALGVRASSRPERIGNYRLWMAAVAIEHAILLFRFVIKTVLPVEPKWVGKAKVQLEASIKSRMQTDDEETEELLEISNHRANTVSTAIVNANIAASIHKVSGAALCSAIPPLLCSANPPAMPALVPSIRPAAL